MNFNADNSYSILISIQNTRGIERERESKCDKHRKLILLVSKIIEYCSFGPIIVNVILF